VLLILQIFYGFMTSIWIVFAIVLFEGLLGGAAYANTFYRIAQEVGNCGGDVRSSRQCVVALVRGRR